MGRYEEDLGNMGREETSGETWVKMRKLWRNMGRDKETLEKHGEE